jgi:hypothetical protein
MFGMLEHVVCGFALGFVQTSGVGYKHFLACFLLCHDAESPGDGFRLGARSLNITISSSLPLRLSGIPENVDAKPTRLLLESADDYRQLWPRRPHEEEMSAW